MHVLAIGVALLAAVAIIAIGAIYLSNPRAATQSFGLPLPEDGANIAWWLRLKGSRDIVSGLVVLANDGLGWLPHRRHRPDGRGAHPDRRHVARPRLERLGEARLRHPWPHGGA